MSPYANLRGNSPVVGYQIEPTRIIEAKQGVRGFPVVGYQIEPTRIIVWFKGYKAYSYSYAKADRANVEEMKRLACNGAGLSAYITHNVHFLYD